MGRTAGGTRGGTNRRRKKLLIQAAACNLALLIRSRFGTGKPKAAHDGPIEQISPIPWLAGLLCAVYALASASSELNRLGECRDTCRHRPWIER